METCSKCNGKGIIQNGKCLMCFIEENIQDSDELKKLMGGKDVFILALKTYCKYFAYHYFTYLIKNINFCETEEQRKVLHKLATDYASINSFYDKKGFEELINYIIDISFFYIHSFIQGKNLYELLEKPPQA